MIMTTIRKQEIANVKRKQDEASRKLNAQIKLITLGSLLAMFTLTAIFGIGN